LPKFKSVNEKSVGLLISFKISDSVSCSSFKSVCCSTEESDISASITLSGLIKIPSVLIVTNWLFKDFNSLDARIIIEATDGDSRLTDLKLSIYLIDEANPSIEKTIVSNVSYSSNKIYINVLDSKNNWQQHEYSLKDDKVQQWLNISLEDYISIITRGKQGNGWGIYIYKRLL
jgi:hypothetical protein